MESDLGKLFIGGISWDTNEDRLREYFKNFGQVVEAVIMKDRTTGRARGFGFVVFANPAVADRVVMEKHLIDGRMVEAKKAIPRDDQYILLNRNNNNLQGSIGPGRTKKIFVGGLASSVTDADFKKYFEQFGTITDVVVMYDHNTQRPRGFGFITFDLEDAVDKVLNKTFHELNGKMVEVKKAVPKELSPGPTTRLPVGGYNYGLNRVNNFLNGYSEGYNPSSIGGYDIRMNDRFGPMAGVQKGYPSFGSGYELGMNFESGMSPRYGGNLNVSGNLGYGRALSPYDRGISRRFGSPIEYSVGSGNPGASVCSVARTLWDNGSLDYNTNPTNTNSVTASDIWSIAGFGNNNMKWRSSSPTTSHVTGSGSGFVMENQNYGTGDNTFGLVTGSYGRTDGIGSISKSFTDTRNGYEGNFTESNGGNSIYVDPTWHSASKELDRSSLFGYGLSAASDVTARGSIDYMSGYNVTNMQINREEG